MLTGLLGRGSFRHHTVERVSCRKTWQRMVMYALNLRETKFAVNSVTVNICCQENSRSLFQTGEQHYTALVPRGSQTDSSAA